MQTGALTAYLDVALLAFNAFFLFFIGLVIYLQRESNREGLPLVTETGDDGGNGFFGVPPPKKFLLADGSTMEAPRDNDGDKRPIKAVALMPGGGAPLVPTGNPMLDGVGPGAYAERRDIPDVTFEGHPRIVPMRIAADFVIEARDTDPRGMPIYGADGQLGGTVRDVWVDRSEFVIRYLEIEPAGAAGARVVMPIQMAGIDGPAGRLTTRAVLGQHFADVPRLKSPDRITFLEEEKVMGYFGAGYLYATPDRQEALL